MKIFLATTITLLSVGYLITQCLKPVVSFPEPDHGYSEGNAIYDDLPPNSPTEIVLPAIECGATTEKPIEIQLATLQGDGIRIISQINSKSDNEADMVVILEISRTFKRTKPILGSVVEILPATQIASSFDIAIRYPAKSGQYDVTLQMLPIDESGAPLHESPITLAVGNVWLPGQPD